MDILFLSQIVPYPPQGGVLQRGFFLIRELGKHHQVDLVAFLHEDILPNDSAVREAKTELLKFCRHVQFIPLLVKKSRTHLFFTGFRSLFSTRPFSFFAYRSKQFSQMIRDFCQSNKYDIVHFDTLALSQYLTDVRFGKTSLTHHNVESDLMRRRSTNEVKFLKKIYYYIDSLKNHVAERCYIPQYDINITCSEVDRQKLFDIAGTHRSVNIPNGVDTAFFRPDYTRQKDNCIIHVGALQSSNLDGMIYFLSDIWPLIKKQKGDVQLLLVGKANREQLEPYINDDCIHITGHVADFRPYVHQASVFIVPLKIGGGTKLKVLDALANGKAVVTTSVGSEGLAVEHGKHLFVEDTPAGFADRVLRLLGDRNSRIRIGKFGRELVTDRYDWRIVGERLSTLYTDFDQK